MMDKSRRENERERKKKEVKKKERERFGRLDLFTDRFYFRSCHDLVIPLYTRPELSNTLTHQRIAPLVFKTLIAATL